MTMEAQAENARPRTPTADSQSKSNQDFLDRWTPMDTTVEPLDFKLPEANLQLNDPSSGTIVQLCRNISDRKPTPKRS
ncbi:hypothetical protein Daesc_005671 [Daldinia eschscholtzii]|uniref:Uncharacterized protein n=1 Tax=Daldinia eschscholtzii TaxID=292717 RepID=A0AAX6ML44_9PEZI